MQSGKCNNLQWKFNQGILVVIIIYQLRGLHFKNTKNMMRKKLLPKIQLM